VTLPGSMVGAAGSPGIRAEDFDHIVREYQARIYRILLLELRDEDAASSLTQECFLRAYRNREGFRGEASVSTWLTRIAINLARDHRRNRRQSFWRRLFGNSRDEEPTMELASAVPDPAASPERSFLAKEEMQWVVRAVESLPDQQRTVFHLRFIEQMSVEEIAAAMNLKSGTVKVHLSRAVGTLRRMRKELKK